MSAVKKVAPSHPSYAQMIKDAIVEIKDRQGATKVAIIKALSERRACRALFKGATVGLHAETSAPTHLTEDKYGNKLSGGATGVDKQISTQLKNMVEKGLLSKPNSSRFRLTDEGKKVGAVSNL